MKGGVILSGASRGLGAALARRLAAPGVTLGLVARSEAGLRAGRGSCTFPRPLVAGLRALSLLPAPLADRAVRLLRFRIDGPV